MDKLQPAKRESCLSCKIITVSCLTTIGGYLIHTAQQYKGNSKIFIIGLGTGAICLGVGETFDKIPFKQ